MNVGFSGRSVHLVDEAHDIDILWTCRHDDEDWKEPMRALVAHSLALLGKTPNQIAAGVAKFDETFLDGRRLH